MHAVIGQLTCLGVFLSLILWKKQKSDFLCFYIHVTLYINTRKSLVEFESTHVKWTLKFFQLLSLVFASGYINRWLFSIS